MAVLEFADRKTLSLPNFVTKSLIRLQPVSSPKIGVFKLTDAFT